MMQFYRYRYFRLKNFFALMFLFLFLSERERHAEGERVGRGVQERVITPAQVKRGRGGRITYIIIFFLRGGGREGDRTRCSKKKLGVGRGGGGNIYYRPKKGEKEGGPYSQGIFTQKKSALGSPFQTWGGQLLEEPSWNSNNFFIVTGMQ